MTDTNRAQSEATVDQVKREEEPRHFQPARKGIAKRLMLFIRDRLIDLKRSVYRNVCGMDLHPTCKFSLKAHFDITNPKGVHVDAGTYVAFGAVILAHDMSRLISTHTRIGKNCFVGAHSIIMPGVVIGDECIVGSGSVVTRDVPSHSICAGNPAKVIKSGIKTREWGILVDAYEVAVARKMAQEPRTRTTTTQ